MYTVLLYLTEPESGGETAFPNESRLRNPAPGQAECKLGIKVRPSRGDGAPATTTPRPPSRDPDGTARG